eukprot:417440_1
MANIASFLIIIKFNADEKSSMIINNLLPTTTITNLKAKIKRQGVEMDGVRLIYGGKQLSKDNLTLADYNVQKDATLFAAWRLLSSPAPSPFQIYIKLDPYGQSAVTIKDLLPTTTIGTLKQKLMDQEGIGAKSSNMDARFTGLIYAGKMLSKDNLTLADYNVGKNSIVFVAFRVRGS